VSSNLTLILTSAVVAAVVSAVVGGVFTLWNDYLRRKHETQLREEDREHERLMQAIADQRSQRDHRGERIYVNVHEVVRLAIGIGDHVTDLLSHPETYMSRYDKVNSAINGLKEIQATVTLDLETAALFSKVGKVIDELNVLWTVLGSREVARIASDQRLPELSKEVEDRVHALRAMLDEVVVEARDDIKRAEATLS
jgi:hypothetical protein